MHISMVVTGACRAMFCNHDIATALMIDSTSIVTALCRETRHCRDVEFSFGQSVRFWSVEMVSEKEGCASVLTGKPLIQILSNASSGEERKKGGTWFFSASRCVQNKMCTLQGFLSFHHRTIDGNHNPVCCSTPTSFHRTVFWTQTDRQDRHSSATYSISSH